MESDEEVLKAKAQEESPTPKGDIPMDDHLALLSSLTQDQILSMVTFCLCSFLIGNVTASE